MSSTRHPMYLTGLVAVAMHLIAAPLPAQEDNPFAPDPPAEEEKAEASKWTAQHLERLRRIQYDRSANKVISALEKGLPDAHKQYPHMLVEHYFNTGMWKELQEELNGLPAGEAERSYASMLHWVTYRAKPFFLLNDLIGLIDTCPGEYTDLNIEKLGALVKGVIRDEEMPLFLDALNRGTAKIGGKDTQSRILAGRILLAADRNDEAMAFFPPKEEIARIADERLREQILSSMLREEERESLEQDELTRDWRRAAYELAETELPDTRKQEHLKTVVGKLGGIPASVYLPWMDKYVRTSQHAMGLLAEATRLTAPSRSRDFDLRTRNLRAQRRIIDGVARHHDLSTEPMKTMVNAMAANWIAECDVTIQRYPIYIQGNNRRRAEYAHVHIEDLIATAPQGEWLEALAPDMAIRSEIGLAKVISATDNHKRAVDIAIRLGDKNPVLARGLSDFYLNVWAKSQNPNLSPELAKRYRLNANDSRITLTRSMQRQSIENLSRLLALMRKHDIYPTDKKNIVTAFDTCHSHAEAYEEADIVSVFGPVEGMNEELLAHVIVRMREALAERWRDLAIQTAAGTQRSEDDLFAMVNAGYETATSMADKYLDANPAAWAVCSLAGAVHADWATFAYFHRPTKMPPAEAMALMKKHYEQAFMRFRQAAGAYAGDLPPHAEAYTIEPYKEWFLAVVGVGAGDIHSRRAVREDELTRIRESITSLPEDVQQEHLELFGKFVAETLDANPPVLTPEVKFKFLSASLAVTGENPFTFKAKATIDYYGELLDELRLKVRVDGSTTVGLSQDFGIFLSIVHTPDMGRELRLERYLSAAPAATGKKGPRELLEEAIRERLSDYFDVRSVTLSDANVQARRTEDDAWRETVLAYVQLRATDASVDRIPSLVMELDFIDKTGPVTLPVESAPVAISVQQPPPGIRPIDHVEISQVLDNREIRDGKLTLNITATGNGLLPPLEALVDLSELRTEQALQDGASGALVKEINSWAESVSAVSERSWMLYLDSAVYLDTPFRFPPVRMAGTEVSRRAYQDMDLVEVEGEVFSPATADDGGASGDPARAWIIPSIITGVGGCVVLLLLWFWRRKHPADGTDDNLRKRFEQVREFDAFVAVNVLKRILADEPGLSAKHRDEIRGDIDRIQDTCFIPDQAGLEEPELRKITKRWLKLVK